MEQSTNYNFNLPSKSDETSADIDLISDNFRTVDDVVKQIQDDVSKTPTNLVNGSATGSLRGVNAKAEGDDYTIGQNAVAIGYGTEASGFVSHAEGNYTTASGNISHAEGNYTTASGYNSHAEGSSTTASGDVSHAEGVCVIASGHYQHAQGKFNIGDANNRYAHIVGNGEDDENRSNAHTLDWGGNAWFAGDVYVGGTSQDDENATKLSSVATDISQIKEKLDGIEEGANKTIVDSELSDTSTNPLQNKVVTEKINSANSTITSINSALDTKVTREVAIVGSNEANSAGWYKVADGTMSALSNISMIFVVHNTLYNAYHSGILQLDLRSDSATENIKCQLGWLVRNGFDADQVIVVTDGLNWAMYCKVKSKQYYRIFFEVMQKSSTHTISVSDYNLYTDSTVEITTPVATHTSSDLGVIKTINENLDKKVNLTNETIYGAVDWNTLTTTGCYKIQNCTMTADYNAPQGEYGFGVLQVLNVASSENRVAQIYIPHRNAQKYNMYIRTNNSLTGYDDWTDWEGFYGGSKLSAALNSKADTETGTCTLSASNGTVSNATYSVVGNMVTLNFNIAPTGAGNVVVSGLPFTATKNQSGGASSTATYNITANQTSVSINSTSGTAEYCTVTYLK